MTGAIAGGCLAFLVGFGLQYGGWRRYLKPALTSGDTPATQRALRRWAYFAVVLEAILLGLSGAIAVAMRSGHVSGFAWAAIPLGALLGSSIPLQTAAASIARRAL